MITTSTDELRAMLADPDPDIRWKARMRILNSVAGYLDAGGEAQQQLVVMLTDSDPVDRQRARDVFSAPLLDGELSDHVRVVLTVLADDTAVDAWPGCAELLRAVVPKEEFDYVVTVLATTRSDELGDRLAIALGLPGGRDLPRFTTEQAGEGASVTCWSCTPAENGPEGDDNRATARCVRVSALVALLGSRLDRVRQRAVRELAELGPGVAGVLRAVCRARTPSRHGALAALAEIGWHELEQADRDLLTRFVQSRQPAETPTPLGTPHEWTAEWYAVPTTDQAAVLDAFDLCEPVPATMRMGLARWRYEDGWHPGFRAAYGEIHPTFEQVYVSPALDGWTLVFANHPTLDGGGPVEHSHAHAAKALHRCSELSRRFGTAHWYAQGWNGFDDYSGWCVYEHGVLARYCYYNPAQFDLPEGEVLVGPTSLADLDTASSPAENLRAWLAEHDTGAGHPPPPPKPRPSRKETEARLLRVMSAMRNEELEEPDEEPEEPDDADRSPDPARDWEFSVSQVAWRLSVSPESFGPDMHVAGTGVLAVPRALRNRPRYGALPV
jgi:hypothetical protein